MLSVLRKLGSRKRALLKNEVLFNSNSEIIVSSLQEFTKVEHSADAQITIMQRRLQGCGATLKPGVLKIVMDCWWSEEAEERVYIFWLDEEGVWRCGRDDLM